MHKFVVMIGGELKTFNEFDDIPEVIDYVIEFLPEIPDPLHSEDQHSEMDMWNSRLQDLMQPINICRVPLVLL